MTEDGSTVEGRTFPDQGDRPESSTPFWNMNIPESQYTEECPDYLQYAFENEKDRLILSTRDSDYKRQSWEEVKKTILENRIDLFDRLPSDLRRYRKYNAIQKGEYGSVMEFIMQERLKWQDQTATGEPFSSPGTSPLYFCLRVLLTWRNRRLQDHIQRLALWTRQAYRPFGSMGEVRAPIRARHRGKPIGRSYP